MEEMNVLQTGVNVAVTQLKSNNCDELQFFLSFFSLPPLLLCTGDWAAFQSLLSSHSDSVGRREKEKCPSFRLHREFHPFALYEFKDGAKGYCLRAVPGPAHMCTLIPQTL